MKTSGKRSQADTPIRKVVAQALRKFNKTNSGTLAVKVTLSDATTVGNERRKNSRKTAAEQMRRLGDVLLVVDLEIAALVALAAEAMHHKGPNRILSRTYPAKDYFLGNYLSNVANSAMAIVNLVLCGLDNQARVLVRTLDERIYQGALLFTAPADYKFWHKAQSDGEAKRAHYLLFRRKGRLLRRLRQVEQIVGMDLGEEMFHWRLERSDFYSLPVHGACTAIHVGEFAFDYDSDHLSPALLGKASKSSKATLEHVRFQLFYFLMLLWKMLCVFHQWKPDMSQPFICYFEGFRLAAIDAAPVWFKTWGR